MRELTLRVPCGGRAAPPHRLRWVDGDVVLDDHPDVDAERALVAFGGEAPACLELLDLWDEALGDGGFLGEWARVDEIPWARISWLHTAIERTRSEGIHEYLPLLPEHRAARMGRFVVEFPGPWLDRAAVEVARRVVSGEGVTCELAPGLVAEATARRLRQAFVRAIAGTGATTGPAALVPLRPLVGVGVEPAVQGRLDGRGSWAAVTVDRSWLPEVWGRGAAVVEGTLVLSLDGGTARAVRWVRAGRGLVPGVDVRRVAHDGDRWRFA